MTSKQKIEYLLFALLSFLILLFGWWSITYFSAIKEFFLPSPIKVYYALIRLFIEDGFLKDVGVSMLRISVGVLIGVVTSLPIGILIGLNKKAEAMLETVIDFIRYMPIPAFIPLFILWFGIGEIEKIVVIASSVFFQLVLMVSNTIGQIPAKFIQSAKILGAGKAQLIIKVIWPYSAPVILNHIRVSLGWAWAGLIMAEVVGSTSGIGYIIVQSQRLLRTANVIAAIIVVGVLGLISDYTFKRIHKYFFPWLIKNDNVKI